MEGTLAQRRDWPPGSSVNRQGRHVELQEVLMIRLPVQPLDRRQRNTKR